VLTAAVWGVVPVFAVIVAGWTVFDRSNGIV